MSIPWKKWLKSLGDDWISQNKILTVEKSNFNYVINGTICFFQFTGTTLEAINLPYKVGFDSVINGTIITKGTNSITLSSPCSGFYFIDLIK